MENAKQYFAFISYKREDEEWAKWLQHKLEHYKLPSNLNGRTDLPKEIRPVFKDTSELNPGNLPQQIHDALEQSKHLIVICSPRSAKSEWVNREVETFIGMGKTDYIIPFIIEGKAFAKNPEEECFPEAIRNLPSEQEILGANIGEMGRDAAAVKVVAQMFGLRFDELWQRYEREQKKRRNKVIFGVAVLALMALGVAGWIWKQNVQLKEKDWNMMASQSRFLSEKAMELASEGDVTKAICLCLEILPRDLDHPDRPYVAEAEYAFRQVCAMDKMADNIIRLKKGGDCHWEEIRKINTGLEDVFSVNFSPDNKTVVTTSEAKLLRIYDIETSKCVYSDSIHYFDGGYAEFSPDGNYVGSTAFDGAYLIDLKNNKKDTLYYEDGWMVCGIGCDLCFSNDGRYLVSSYEDKHRVFDISDGGHIKEIELSDGYKIGTYWISPNSKELIAKDYSEEGVIYRVYELSTGRFVRVLDDGYSEAARNDTVSYSRDGMLKAEISGGVVTIYQMRESTQDYSVDSTSILAISPDESMAATVSMDGSSIALWDLDSQEMLFQFNELATVANLDFSEDSKYLLAYSQGYSVRVWNTHTGGCEKVYGDRPYFWASFDSKRNGIILYSFDEMNGGRLRSFDMADGTIRWEVIDEYGFEEPFEKTEDYVYKIKDKVYVVDLDSGEIMEMPFDNDGFYIFDDVLVHPTQPIVFVTETSFGSHFGSSSVQVYDFKCRDTIGTISPNDDRQMSLINNVAISSDGEHLITVSSSSNQICLYEMSTLECKASVAIPELVTDHYGRVQGKESAPNIGFIPSGDSFYYEGKDGIYIFNVEAGEIIGYFPKVGNCYFSRNGHYLICQDQDKNWSILKYHSLKSLLKMIREKYDGVAFTPEERHQYYLE